MSNQSPSFGCKTGCLATTSVTKIRAPGFSLQNWFSGDHLRNQNLNDLRSGDGFAVGAAVGAPRRARLAHHDLAQARQRRLQPIPDPLGEHFAGRVLEARDLVQVAVIEALP